MKIMYFDNHDGFGKRQINARNLVPNKIKNLYYGWYINISGEAIEVTEVIILEGTEIFLGWSGTKPTKQEEEWVPNFQDGNNAKSFIEVATAILRSSQRSGSAATAKCLDFDDWFPKCRFTCFHMYGSQHVDVGSITRQQLQLLFQTWPKSNPLQTFLSTNHLLFIHPSPKTKASLLQLL